MARKGRLVIFKYFVAWFGMMVLAVANGGFRDTVYKPHVGDLAAHQISTVILLAILSAYFWLLTSIWQIESPRQAWAIGLLWLSMTLTFEIVLGRLIAGNPWSKVLADYDLRRGRVWILIPLWVFIGPYVLFRRRKAR